MQRTVRVAAGLLAAGAAVYAGTRTASVGVGRLPDGGFVVATGQRIEPGTIAFDGRPIDIALHPTGEFAAVLNQGGVLLLNRSGVIPGSTVKTAAGASYRGIAWSPDGTRLYCSLSKGGLERFRLDGTTLRPDGRIPIVGSGDKRNPVPGGMAFRKDGARLFVACADLNSVAEVDTAAGATVKLWPVQNTPFDVRLSEDEGTLVVSNWGGRLAGKGEGDEEAESGTNKVVVDSRGVASTGTVSLIRLPSGHRIDIPVGLHPAGLALSGNRAYVANAGSDSVSEVDIAAARVLRTFRVEWQGQKLFGSMPNAVAVRGDRLYACDGGDNAVAEIDLASGKAVGFRGAGFFPTGIQLTTDGHTAWVVNNKGNGSVRETVQSKPGNTHNFQGTVSVIDLREDLAQATKAVASNNGWDRSIESRRPKLAVYNGAIKHVLYVIKENRTYDQVLGDMREGNGDARLCTFGEAVTPNHHALAREFTLFDNAYTSGTNSAEGHQWAVEGLANDYIERFYGGYSRSYPYDGGDAMAYASSGFLWDSALKRGKSVRVYGEFCKEEIVEFNRRPKTWLEAWKDRESGSNSIKVTARTTVNGLRKYIHPSVICWPLLMSDQWRADKFIEEYQSFSKADRVPNLMILTLPSDHTEGTSPAYPKPRSMVADNDLALGRVVEAVSKSPQWKDTCIFVMEDDSQAGFDHVDGHRTVCYAISPYTRRAFVDSTMYTQIGIVRSIGLMLGLPPMNRFDALAAPFAACFTETPDLRPYTAVPNRVQLGDMNPALTALRGKERYWAEKSLALDWSDVDSAEWYTLNRILWHNARGADTPYPTD
jgi:DNA-binding beta-propeller fold protein YncE